MYFFTIGILRIFDYASMNFEISIFHPEITTVNIFVIVPINFLNFDRWFFYAYKYFNIVNLRIHMVLYFALFI